MSTQEVVTLEDRRNSLLNRREVKVLFRGAAGKIKKTDAASITREFLDGYIGVAGRSNIAKLAKSRRYIETFYPVLAPPVAREIKKEIKNFA